jgi:hypothetical protein
MSNKALNFQTLLEIDTTPEGATRTYARLGDGISSVTFNNNEEIDQAAYLDGNGGKSSEVTGFQFTAQFSGAEVPTDPAQAYIAKLQNSIGSKRHTTARITGASGRVKSGDVTIRDIVVGGGDANAKGAFSFQVDFNGKPTDVEPVAADALTETFAAGSASGTTKATGAPATGDSLYYELSAAQKSVNGRQYLDLNQVTSYTSGNDIAATVGQYLTVYEVDAYWHVVKAVSHEVASGEIKS